MQLPQGNPKLPDDINNKDQKPLLDFLLLAAGVVAGLLLLSVVLLKSAQWLAPHVPYQWERDWFASLPETEEDSASNAVTSADQTADQASNYTKEQALNALMSRLLAKANYGHIVRKPFVLPVVLILSLGVLTLLLLLPSLFVPLLQPFLLLLSTLWVSLFVAVRIRGGAV